MKKPTKDISIDEYNKIMNKVIKKNKNKPVHDTLIRLIEEASKYNITIKKKRGSSNV